MKILVIGATGRTGRRLLEQALERRHAVTAMVRNASNVSEFGRGSARIIVADPSSAAELEAILPGHEVAISCLGQTSKSNPSLLRDAAAAMVDSIGRSGNVRYIVVSQGLLFPSRSPIVHLLRLVLRRITADSAAMESVVRFGGISWTVVRPPWLLDGGAARGYRAVANTRPHGRASMQRIDLATFLLDEAERAQYVETIVGVTSA